MSTPATDSLISSLVERPDREQLLAELSDEEAAAIIYDWALWARESQLPPAGDWRIWLLLSGRGYGKTRVGAEWVRAQVAEFEFVNLIGPTAADVRDVMVQGESGIMASCPPHERPVYHPSTRSLSWPNGARSLTFSAEDPEQLRGPQHQRLWCDEAAAWSNHTREETYDLAMLGLRLPPDPRALITTTPKPVPLLRELVEDPKVIITKGSTFENIENLAPAFIEQVVTKYEGTRLGRQELEAELLLDEGLAYRFSTDLHVVPPFEVPNHWQRFEGLDHGSSAPCAWIAFAADTEGNIVAHAAYYSPGLVSEHAAAIKKARQTSWARDSAGSLEPALCYADPTIRNTYGIQVKGRELSVEREYNDHGLSFVPGQNDRRAGYLRVAELLNPDPDRYLPVFHARARKQGAPRLYIMDKPELEPLRLQLRDAPLEDIDSPESRWPGEAVDFHWESRTGHAHAAARYALMSRPAPSEVPGHIPDPRLRTLRDQWNRSEKERRGRD